MRTVDKKEELNMQGGGTPFGGAIVGKLCNSKRARALRRLRAAKNTLDAALFECDASTAIRQRVMAGIDQVADEWRD